MKIIDAVLKLLGVVEEIRTELKEFNANFAEYKRNLNQVQARR